MGFFKKLKDGIGKVVSGVRNVISKAAPIISRVAPIVSGIASTFGGPVGSAIGTGIMAGSKLLSGIANRDTGQMKQSFSDGMGAVRQASGGRFGNMSRLQGVIQSPRISFRGGS